MSSNDSPPPNFCSALHLNLTGVPLEPLSASSAFPRVPARKHIPCLIGSGTLCPQSPQPLPDSSLRRSAVPCGPQSGGSYSYPDFHKPSTPRSAHSKYIAFHEGGFLHVAVSEAPALRTCNCALLSGGAPDTALGLIITYPAQNECIGDYA